MSRDCGHDNVGARCVTTSSLDSSWCMQEILLHHENRCGRDRSLRGSGGCQGHCSMDEKLPAYLVRPTHPLLSPGSQSQWLFRVALTVNGT